MKRILSLLLVAVMLVGLFPSTLAADSNPEPRSLNATELTGLSRLDEEKQEPAENRQETPGYQPEDLVTVIVTLTDEPVLAGFDRSSVSGISAGEAVSQYLTDSAAETRQAQLQQAQSNLLSAMGQDVKLVSQWTNLVNAVAVEVPYGRLAEIQAMDGVESAYVQHVYDRPIEEMGTLSQEGTHGYSYDLVGLSGAWEAGFTGKGMLVAVLDTGLDLTWATWGDSSNLNVGVRRVHQAFTEDSFRNDPDDAKDGWELRYTEESMARLLQSTQLRANTGSEGQHIIYAHNDPYKNRKVPFAADYADGDLNVQPSDSNHGTHVSGTVAGYAETEEGEVLFSGVAPDAQILAMKVFPDADGGATEASILNALEDTAVLGADVVNLSLGSDNGFADDGSAASAVYKRLNDAGILFMTSAGNAGYSSVNNNYGGNTLTSDPEISMMSSPAIYGSNLAVASMENTVQAQSTLTWSGLDGQEHKIAFQDSTGVAMKYKFAGQGAVNVIPVDGYGTYEDYSNAGFRNYYGSGEKGETGIALVKRGGGISFVDKINMATRFTWSYYDSEKGTYVAESPVKAVIIYDEDPEATELINMSTDGSYLTSAFITGKDGAALVEAAKAAMSAGSYASLTVQKEDEVISSPEGGKMSTFSSWGAGPSLELKPEITAPGGNIWSTVMDTTYSPAKPGGLYDDYEGSYGMMSGTSMAAPHMTGLTALVQEYVQKELGVTAKVPTSNLAQQLLVSTALPLQDENGVYYSPRQQGAGLVNVDGAVKTPAYISVQGQKVGKLELQDDWTRQEYGGGFRMNFTVHNLFDQELTYNMKAVLLVPGTDTVETQYGTRDVMLASDVLLREVDLGSVTVPASGIADVKKIVPLTEEEKADLNAKFKNGTYVEGFIILTDASEAEEKNPQIGLPFLAYYGDWTDAPIFDSALWVDEPTDGENVLNNEAEWGVSILGYTDGYSYYNLGQNPFDSNSGNTQQVFHPENITISPTGFFKCVNDYVLYQKREARVIVVQVTDAKTGEVYYQDYSAMQFKTYYDQNYGMAIPSSLYYFTNSDYGGSGVGGAPLPSGTECIYTITAYGAGDFPMTYDESGREVVDYEEIASGLWYPEFNGHRIDMTGDVISVPLRVDSEAPQLENSAVSVEVQDGKTTISGKFTDDGAIASVEVVPLVKRTAKSDPTRVDYAMDRNNSFYAEYIYDAGVGEWTFTADVTEYSHVNETYEGENNIYDFQWTGDVYIFGGDYGGNDRAYAVTVDSTPGLVLSTTSALLYVGSSFDLSITNNTGSDAPLTLTSSNPEVATIDEFGHVKALKAGQAVMEITNGTETAYCIVAVREKNTEIIDFDLSIASFSGLKPGGSMVVKVQNLQPADVELNEIRWEVFEDDPDLYTGLINCARYTSDGLTGEVYLNYSATGSNNPPVPGASGTLKVTLNGVTREMKLDWEDLYTERTDEDLVSNLNYGDQTVYVNQGEDALLHAKYNDTSAHSIANVDLWTGKNYNPYDSEHSQEAAEGLILDGPDFCSVNSTWTGKLVNQEGYTLPEQIRVFTRYESGYEYEMTNSWRQDFAYNAETGEVNVYFTPPSVTSTLVIRADGVESAGNPAGTVSGETYERPSGLYGPFDWELVSGNGTLTTEEDYNLNGTTLPVAHYTPAEPGCSIVKATTKDGKYSVNFTVISQPVMPETVELKEGRLTLHEGESQSLTATLTPEPTLEKHEALIWKSYDESVATVDETGKITAVAPGFAFVTVSSPYVAGAMSQCIVEVLPCQHAQTETVTVPATCEEDGSVTVTCKACGKVISTEVLPKGHTYTAVVTEPTCTEGGFTTYTCTVCGHSYVGEHTDALGHDFEVTVVESQEGAEGYTLHTCRRCGYSFRDSYTAPLPCPSSRFTDVDTSRWYHEGVDFVVAKELMNGMTDTLFQPDGTLTRGQLMTILYRMAGTPETEAATPFTDVASGRYFTDAVAWAYEAGIAEGVSGTTFAPNAPVTREQLVTFLYRYAKYQEEDVSAQGNLAGYPDAEAVSEYAQIPMAWAVEQELVNGIDGKLAPKGAATRAQIATIILRYYAIYGE